MIAQGPSADLNRDLLNDFLQEGQAVILEKAGASILARRCVIRLSAGSRLYDWHDDQDDVDIDPGWVGSVWVQAGDTHRDLLVQGITERQRESTSSRGLPERYDTLSGQLEVWPTPSEACDLIINYTLNETRLEQDQDRPSVPWRLLLAYAVSVGKAHYRHPDAQVAGQMFTQLLAAYTGRQHENRRYVAHRGIPASAGVVMTSDGRFTLER
ncbi:hypothetical protein C0J09_10935 [Bordetella avium]|nr:hypothetical protein C0J09_10935 [Bordetella avium]